MCTLLVPEPMGNNQIGLRNHKGWGDEPRTATLKNATGEYQGQVSLAWDQGIDLWIVDQSERELQHPDCLHVDELSKTPPEKIPKYENRARTLTYTSVIIPVGRDVDGRRVGVVNFELGRVEHCSESLETEFREVAHTVQRLYGLHMTYTEHIQSSLLAFNNLPSFTAHEVRSVKPEVFFAFSNRAKDDVIAVVNDVLRDWNLQSWRADVRAGLIPQQIMQRVRKCQYAICYLSEPTGSNGSPKFQDNLNVIYEAGMLNAILDTQWIPIREEDSPEIAFDIHANRTIPASRDNSGNLNRERLKEILQATLNSFS